MFSFNNKRFLRYLFLTFFLLITLRVLFFALNYNSFIQYSKLELLKSFFIGVRFDGRVALILSIPVFLGILISRYGIKVLMFCLLAIFGVVGYSFSRASSGIKRFLMSEMFMDMLPYIIIVLLVIIILYLIKTIRELLYNFILTIPNYFIFTSIFILQVGIGDFFNYNYLEERMSFATLELMLDVKEASGMISKSYPIFTILIISLISLILFVYIGKKYLSVSISDNAKFKYTNSIGIIFTLIISVFLLYGQVTFTKYPLRWSQAHHSIYKPVVALAISPIHNVFDTLPIQANYMYDTTSLPIMRDMVAKDLDIDTTSLPPFRLDRVISGRAGSKPNIVLIIVESLSSHKSTFFKDELQSTPFLKSLSEKSYYFNNHYANSRTTARAMFTIMTGIPDANPIVNTSSRDIKAVDQHLILNDFNGYKKYFQMAGSANWANIRGIFTANIEDITVFEEGYWESSPADVWGVSDLDLLLESNKIFADSKEPFVSVILTSSFHRPFTVPDSSYTPGFNRDIPDKNFLDSYGFLEDEYLSMRFVDYSIARFFEEAAKNPYFNNTIFIITGDHGISERSPSVDTIYQDLFLHAYQVPLIIYSPLFENDTWKGLLPQEKVISMAASHVDIMPTMAYLAGVEYQNTAIGKNLFNKVLDPDRHIFIRDEINALFVSDKDLLIINNIFSKDINQRVSYFIKDDPSQLSWTSTDGEDYDYIKHYLTDMLRSYYGISQYLIHNNSKKRALEVKQKLLGNNSN